MVVCGLVVNPFTSFKLTGGAMWSALLLLAILATPSTSSPHPLAENRQDFGSANLGLWNVNLNEVYDFFASPKVQRNFAILLTSKVSVLPS